MWSLQQHGAWDPVLPGLWDGTGAISQPHLENTMISKDLSSICILNDHIHWLRCFQLQETESLILV